MRRERGEGFYVYIYVALLVVVNMYVVTIVWTCLKTNTYIYMYLFVWCRGYMCSGPEVKYWDLSRCRPMVIHKTTTPGP